jgi:hypothetical protein
MKEKKNQDPTSSISLFVPKNLTEKGVLRNNKTFTIFCFIHSSSLENKKDNFFNFFKINKNHLRVTH